MQRSLLKRVLFRLHWAAGISAGLVLAVVGFTGGVLGMEEPVLRLLNPQFELVAGNRTPLSPDQWIADVQIAYPQQAVRGIAWEGADEAVRVRVAREGARAIEVAVDPYDGSVLGTPRGAAFFETVEQLHRTLAAGPIGKQIVGASVALMLLFIATGIYLRWPRRARSPAAWLRMDFRLKGRGFYWHLHAVSGTWLLAFYLVAALTGLWWSYDFYRAAISRIAGVSTPARRAPQASSDATHALPSLDLAWSSFRHAAPDATRASIALPPAPDAPLEIRYQTAASPHERAWNVIKVDLAGGTITSREAYADLPRGRRFVTAVYPLHSGSFFGVPGRVLMAFAALMMPLFAVTGLWMWRLRRRNEALRRRHAPAVAAPSVFDPDAA